ncbi:metalloregulator ArsR/SmtB family transcription factor [Embleya sp. NPDC005575]|uniref:ArsR/SmtB family transcription factor n=1 Tax=Embleya sp. NPDC005575 TaxID=3156892 RepID=UPI0033ADA1EE
MVMSVDADLLKVLADPLRLRIVTLLASEALCASHLVEETGAKQTNLSNHLKVLREAGMVDTEPCGRFVYYRLRPDALDTVATALGDLAANARDTVVHNRKRPC